MTPPIDLLAIMAHPDDAELLCAGTLIKAADAGQNTGVIDLSRGELGSKGTPELRAREAAAAAEVMGLSVRRNAGLPDAGVTSSGASRQRVVELIRELRPRVVITHAQTGRHPDHRETAQLVNDACFLAGLTNYAAQGERHRPFKLVYATAFREDASPPSFVVDISRQMDRKIEALEAYGSQFDGAKAMGEVYPGGDRLLFDQVRAHHAVHGSLIRVAFGEPFRLHETIEVESIVDMSVSTF